MVAFLGAFIIWKMGTEVWRKFLVGKQENGNCIFGFEKMLAKRMDKW